MAAVGASETMKEEDMERDFLLQRPLRDRNAPIIMPIFEAILLTICALIPAAIVRQLPNYNEYDITENKGYVGLNSTMEFWRYSVFIIAAYWAFTLILIAIQVLPATIVKMVEGLTGKTSLHWRRQMYFIRFCRYPMAAAAFMFALVLLSTNLLFHTSFLETVTPVVKPRPPTELMTYLLERFYIFLLLFLSLYAFAQYVVEVFAYNHHKSAFAKRICIVNYNFTVIDRLYQALCRGVATKDRTNKQEKKKKHGHQSQSGLFEDDLELSSPKGPETVASETFAKLCPANRDYIKADDIRPYFDEAELSRAFSVFDTMNTGRVSLSEFTEALVNIHEERINLEKSLIGNSRIVRKLSKVATVMATALSVLVGVALFKLEATAIVVVFGVLYMGFNFMVQQSMTDIYDAISFIFVEHAYDVGDRVIIKGESLLVEKINLYTTVFRKWDGTAVFIPSSVLAATSIYNIRRSGNSSELIEVQVSTTVPIDRIWAFRDRMLEFVRGNPKDFTENLDIATIDVIDSKQTKFTLLVEYLGNFQNLAMKTARRNLLDARIKQLRAEMEI